MRKKNAAGSLVLAGAILSTLLLPGCAGKSHNDGKTEVTMVQYKPEAVAAFEEMEERFNATHDDIHLTIESPNEAMTVLKTRFIREDYPDIIGIGGDINYSNFLDADMFLDVSDFEGVQDIKPAYMDIVDELEFIPKDGVYGLPYVANCAGILYNKDMFEENGWEIPTTWSEFTALCEQIQSESDVYPLDIRTPGPVWHPGMRWQSDCPRRLRAAMSTPERPPSAMRTRRSQKKTRLCWNMQNRIRMRTAITTPAPHLPVENLQCIPSAAMQCRRSSRSIRT